MKRIGLLLLVALCLCAAPGAFAAETAPLGNTGIGFKIDYLNFCDGGLERADVGEAAYFGLEAYQRILWDLYVGLEVGYANAEGDRYFGHTELDYVPVELNAKYAFQLIPNLALDVGTGFSLNYAEFTISNAFDSDSLDDWMFGGQFFTDLNYTYGMFFAGANLKYTLTEGFSGYDVDMDNWRLGGQVGVHF